MNVVPNDPLLKTIQNITSSNSIPAEIHNVFRSVFRFLRWKLQMRPEHFTQEDEVIIQQSDHTKFHLLSSNCGHYTKELIKQYTELLWSASTGNEFLNEGHSVLPKPRCTPLQLNPGTDRKTEVLLMSMLYNNNLTNAFLFRHNFPEIASPLCHCGVEDQTPAHVILHCDKVDQDLRTSAMNCLEIAGDGGDTVTAMLNLSRDDTFINILYQIICVQSEFLRSSIDLK